MLKLIKKSNLIFDNQGRVVGISGGTFLYQIRNRRIFKIKKILEKL